MGGYEPSKSRGIKSNHGTGNWPRNKFVDNQIAGIGFLVLVGLKEGGVEIEELQYLEDLGSVRKSKVD